MPGVSAVRARDKRRVAARTTSKHTERE
jgi:hypothetical protein